MSGFPGVDTVTSRAILSEFGTLESVFTAEFKDLQKVKGVGPKIAGRIRRLLSTKYPGAKVSG
jgi:ERCC4-type nuclease